MLDRETTRRHELARRQKELDRMPDLILPTFLPKLAGASVKSRPTE